MSLSDYLNEISQYPLLSRDEEFEIACKAKEGDEESKELLVNSNLRFVVSIAKKFAFSSSLEDLVQYGNIGLVEAVEQFDPHRGCRLTTYSSWWIKKEMLDYLQQQSGIKLSKKEKEMKKKIYSIISDQTENGIPPDANQIAEELNKTTNEDYNGEDVRFLLDLYKGNFVRSLNEPKYDEGNEHIEYVTGNKTTVIDGLTSKSIVQDVEDAIQNLNLESHAKSVLESILLKNMSLKEVSNEFNLKREKVQQEYSRALRFLRYALKDSGFIDELKISVNYDNQEDQTYHG